MPPVFLMIFGGVLPYMGYIGMCGPKGVWFSAVLVINRVSIFALFFGRSYFFITPSFSHPPFAFLYSV